MMNEVGIAIIISLPIFCNTSSNGTSLSGSLAYIAGRVSGTRKTGSWARPCFTPLRQKKSRERQTL